MQRSHPPSPPPTPAVGVSESHLAAPCFILRGLKNCIAGVMGAQSLLHLCLKVTAEEGRQARWVAGVASHFEGSPESREREGRVQQHFVITTACSDVWAHILPFRKKMWLRGSERSKQKTGAFEAPGIVLALWETYLYLQHTHREAELWSKSRLDQSWLRSPSSGC